MFFILPACGQKNVSLQTVSVVRTPENAEIGNRLRNMVSRLCQTGLCHTVQNSSPLNSIRMGCYSRRHDITEKQHLMDMHHAGMWFCDAVAIETYVYILMPYVATSEPFGGNRCGRVQMINSTWNWNQKVIQILNGAVRMYISPLIRQRLTK